MSTDDLVAVGPRPASPPCDEIFDALAEDDLQLLRTHLSDIGIAVADIEGMPQWNAVNGPGVLAAAFAQASRSEHGVALLMIFVLRACENVWEVSYHYGPIWAALRGAAAWLAEADLTASERATAEAAASLLEMAGLEIEVENAMTSGRLGGFGDAADGVMIQLDRATLAAGNARSACPRLSAYVQERAMATRAYYKVAGEVGRSLRGFFTEPGQSLQPAIDAVAEVERGGYGIADNRVSELRAHRHSMQALQAAASRPWLHIEAGRLIYLFPFVVLGPPPEVARRTVAEALPRPAEDGDSGCPGWDLDGVVPAAVQKKFNLDDVWDGSDLFGRKYDGAVVDLPEVTVTDRSGKHLATLSAQLRLSAIGNHYLRLETDLLDANPHDVYSAMFLAAPEHGTVRVDVANRTPDAHGRSRPPWDRLSDFAQDLTTAVARELGGQPVDATDTAAERDESLVRRGVYHVLAVVHAASTSSGPVGPRTELETRDELMAAVGVEALLNPVTHCVSSLVEWSRYPIPAETNLMPLITHRDDVVVRTANTTVFVSLGQPSFHTQTRETVAEFVASIDGLFARWGAELTLAYRAIDAMLDQSEELDESATIDQIRESARRLRSEHQRLNDFVADIRSTVALIESPALVASPVVSAMKARLLLAAGFRERAEELDRQVDQVLGQRLVNRIAATARGLEQRLAREEEVRERRARRRMDTALAVIAAVGVSGLGQIIQSGYDVKHLGALWITLVIVVLAFVFGWVVRTGTEEGARRRGRWRKQPREQVEPEPRSPTPMPTTMLPTPRSPDAAVDVESAPAPTPH